MGSKWLALALLAAPAAAATGTSYPIVEPLPTAPERYTEHLLLSGADSASPRWWSVLMETGPRAGQELPIAVPGQWETSGFGTYTYGHDEADSDDRGRYRTGFLAPERWRGRRVELVFEGVMTDTTALLNGQMVGPTHQGGYTEFRYDLSPFLRFGEVNTLDVLVSERSGNTSVNLAEREADYWVFGGIYRPVRLEILPAFHLRQVSIDARHDGAMVLEVETSTLDGANGVWWVDVELVEGGSMVASAPVGPSESNGGHRTKVVGQAAGFSAWTAEAPSMAMVEVRLRRGSEVVHASRERFGFRTVEVARPGRIGLSPGLWVNGQRVFLRGVNRHDSWPASGRAMARQRARADAEAILALGFNAVRMSHYPPSRAFLDACDELGLYVINELPGWHDPYDTGVGRGLVAEMVRRDVNHPSVILWANGNEGGWNRTLNQDFGLHDPQRRAVILPDEIFGDFDTRHYPTWSELESRVDPGAPWSWLQRLRRRPPLILPTEVLHALWDGGGGASLEDYLERLRGVSRGVGFFIWAFADEAVVRADRGGELDAAGNYAPDGILGPWREWEASAFAVRDVVAPIRVVGFDPRQGEIELENRFDHTDLASIVASWRWIDLPESGTESKRDLGGSRGAITPAPPRRRGRLAIGVAPEAADAVELAFQRSFDGREVASAVLRLPRDWRVGLPAGGPVPTLVELRGDEWILEAGSNRASIDHRTGELLRLTTADGELELRGGTRRADGGQTAIAAARPSERSGVVRLDLDFEAGGALRTATWRLGADGRLHFAWLGEARRALAFDGIRFELPTPVASIEWVGGGPCPVWRNRLAGARPGVWRQPALGLGLGCNQPVGFFREVEWMELAFGSNLLRVEPEAGLFVGVGEPEFPKGSKEAVAKVPRSGLTLLHQIPAIGTKFHPVEDLGPTAGGGLEGPFRGSVVLSVRRASP